VAHKVTLIPGDGIGPEVARATVRAVEATGVRIDWETIELNAKVLEESHDEVPEYVIDSIERTRVGLKGPVTTPVGTGFHSANVQLRKRLDLFANFRPVRSFPGIRTRYSDVHIDIVMFRENTEDLYSGLENEIVKDVVTSLKIITRAASHRIAKYAFEYARREKRHKITAIHKANIMKLGDGLFLRCCREVARDFPEIEYREMIVDNAAMQLVMRPETFDVLLMPNLYGDIISDLASGLIGGLGLVPGANLGEGRAIFEAVHGSAPDIAGKGIANPTALMQSAALMLAYLDEHDVAHRLQSAIEWVYATGQHKTPDVGGTGTTEEFTNAVVERIQSGK
jgi:isocitrate dehydrogenase (NAD+)